MTYGIKTDHLLTKMILEGVRMCLCNPLTKSLRYLPWDQLLWDHFSSFPSYEPFTVCDLLARCKQGEWREHIHSKQLSQVGGTCSCTQGLEQKDRQWAKQPHDWMWTARVFTECLSRQYLIFIHSSLCIGALTIPTLLIQHLRLRVLLSSRTWLTKGRARPGRWSKLLPQEAFLEYTLCCWLM